MIDYYQKKRRLQLEDFKFKKFQGRRNRDKTIALIILAVWSLILISIKK